MPSVEVVQSWSFRQPSATACTHCLSRESTHLKVAPRARHCSHMMIGRSVIVEKPGAAFDMAPDRQLAPGMSEGPEHKARRASYLCPSVAPGCHLSADVDEMNCLSTTLRLLLILPACRP